MDPQDETIQKKELVRQIGVLKQSLVDSEQSWMESKLYGIRNTVAESIRKDVAEKEVLLDGLSTDSVG